MPILVTGNFERVPQRRLSRMKAVVDGLLGHVRMASQHARAISRVCHCCQERMFPVVSAKRFDHWKHVYFPGCHPPCRPSPLAGAESKRCLWAIGPKYQNTDSRQSHLGAKFYVSPRSLLVLVVCYSLYVYMLVHTREHEGTSTSGLKKTVACRIRESE
ncbi:hypothetical protein OG21DRAFT_360946 [Imleria badia]|nr:hypothetical protein OG21DRAFT_360946 [Imleria badia]